jgi:hypothetical protein
MNMHLQTHRWPGHRSQRVHPWYRRLPRPGTLIRHAGSQPRPVRPLPIAMIQLPFRAFLMIFPRYPRRHLPPER